MATTTTKPDSGAAQPPLRGGGGRLGRDRPLGGLELWTWLFMRISGLLLLVLALGHTLIMHLPGGGVDRINFGFVAARWQSPLWRTWDWMLLSLALIHGINGLRNITLDYVRQAGARLAINMFFNVLGFVLLVLGSIIVFTFDPARWAGQY
jgi:succinate dehydrogenase / fumarate reductase membrane anchor subunit